MRIAEVLLQGLVGSKAYGMDHADSDNDYLGVFAMPTMDFALLSEPTLSQVTSDPDRTIHEARKFCRLALKCNPTILDLLWTTEYQVKHPLGAELLDIRKAFLSERYVRNSYFGYAEGQFKRIESRGDNSFSADTRKRTAKHARHLIRLLDAGITIHKTGQLDLRVNADKRESYFEFGERVAAGDLDLARGVILGAEYEWDESPSNLRDEPSVAPVIDWLKTVRRHFWETN